MKHFLHALIFLVAAHSAALFCAQESSASATSDLTAEQVVDATNLIEAAMDDDTQDVRNQLKKLKDETVFLKAGNSENGYSALMYAVANGNVKMVKLIISYITKRLNEEKARWYLNLIDDNDQTALIIAAEKYNGLNSRNDQSGIKRKKLRDIIQTLRNYGTEVTDEEMNAYPIFGGYHPEIPQEERQPRPLITQEVAEATQKEEEAKKFPKKRTSAQKAQMRPHIEFALDTKPESEKGENPTKKGTAKICEPTP